MRLQFTRRGMLMLRTALRMFACFAALLPSCAHSTEKRLEHLEAQGQNMQVVDLRLANAEERLTRVEQDLGVVRAATSGKSAPRGRTDAGSVKTDAGSTRAGAGTSDAALYAAAKTPAEPKPEPRKVEPRPVEPKAAAAKKEAPRTATKPEPPSKNATAQKQAQDTTPEHSWAEEPIPATITARPSQGKPSAQNATVPGDAAHKAVPKADPKADSKAAPRPEEGKKSAPQASAAPPAQGPRKVEPKPVAPRPEPTQKAAPQAREAAPAQGPRKVEPKPPASRPEAAQKPAPVSRPEPASKAEEKSPASAQGAYQTALNAYEKHRYEEGEKAFGSFLQKYPTHALTPNALYWQGECYYAQGKYDVAILKFKDVAGTYPKHQKAAAALLKAGYAYAQLKDMSNARFYWQMLIDDFPGSEPARMAKKRLGEE